MTNVNKEGLTGSIIRIYVLTRNHFNELVEFEAQLTYFTSIT